MASQINNNQYKEGIGSLVYEGLRDDLGIKPLFNSRYPAFRLTIHNRIDGEVMIIGVHKKEIILSFARLNGTMDGFIDTHNVSRHNMFDLGKIIHTCSILPKADAILTDPNKVRFICEYVSDKGYGVKSYLGELPKPIRDLFHGHEEISLWIQ